MDNNGQNIPLFEVDYDFDREHVTKMFKYPASKLFRIQNVLRYIVAPLSLVSGLIILFSYFFFRLDLIVVLYAGFMFILFSVLEFLRFPEMIARRIIKRDTGAKGSMRCHYTFDDTFVYLWSERGVNTSFTYEHITSFAEDAEAFIMTIDSINLLRVPKFMFTNGDPNRFADFIKSRMSGKGKVSVRTVISIIMMIFLIFTILVMFAVLFLMVFAKIIESGAVFNIA